MVVDADSGNGGIGQVGWVTWVNGSTFELILSNWGGISDRHASTCTFSGGRVSIAGGAWHNVRGFLGPPVPANAWWTWTPTENRWYRSNEHLTYGTSGTNINVETSAMFLQDAGLGWHDYWAHAWNDNGNVTVHWAGGWDNQNPSLSWRTDTAPGGTWLRGTQYARWQWSDALSGIKSGWYRWNGGATTDGGCGYAQLPQGKNTLQIYVEDNAWYGGSQSGNSATISAEFWLDNINPEISISSAPQASTWYHTAQSISWTATDATSGISAVRIQWDGGAWKNVPASGSEAVPEGIHSGILEATDVAGNVKQQPIGPFWLDLTLPTVKVTVPQVSAWHKTPQSISWVVTDPISGVASVTLQWDNGEKRLIPATGTEPIPEGVHSATLEATDVAGNVKQQPLGPFWLDFTAPTAQLSTPKVSVWYSSPQSVSWTSSDTNSGLAGVTLQWDNGVPHPVSPNGSEMIPEGIHTVSLTATDTAGNMTTSTDGPFWIDFTAPTTPQGVEWESLSATSLRVNWQASTDNLDPSPTYQVYRDGVSIGTFTGLSVIDSNLSSSTTYTYTVQAFDDAGNASELSTPVEATTDTLIGTAKKWPDGREVDLAHKTVAAVFPDCFYIMDPLTAGIRVEALNSAVVTGEQVHVKGTLRTSTSGERYVELTQVAVTGSGDLKSAGMTNKTLGGGDTAEFDPLTSAGQRGIEDAEKGPGKGINNVGLLVTTTGRVMAYGDDFFYIDDGTDARDYSVFRGIRVLCGSAQKPELGQQVAVTGVSSIMYVGERFFRSVRLRSENDIVKL